MTFTKDDLKRVIWTVIQAGLGAAVVVISAQGSIPKDWDTAQQVGYAAIIAFVAGAISALKNALLNDSSSIK